MMKTEIPSLKEILSEHTHEGTLTKDLGNGKLECFSCGHRCVIGDGKEGSYRVRFNRDGKLLRSIGGYVGGVQLDPVEKKPFFHTFPGSRALSFGMFRYRYHCSYCRIWVTWQAFRDPEAISSIQSTDAEDLPSLALERKAKKNTSTRNEPLATPGCLCDVACRCADGSAPGIQRAPARAQAASSPRPTPAAPTKRSR